MSPTSSQNEERDDQDWLETLAGREIPEAKSETQKEAEVWRAVLIQHQRSMQVEDEISTEREIKKLLQRLEKEKLLDESKRSGLNTSFYSAIAASFALLAVGLVWLLPGPAPIQPFTSPGFQVPSITRNVLEVQTIISNDFAKTARAMTTQLEVLQIPYRLNTINDSWQLDFYIPLDAPQEILMFLESWRLHETESGWVRVEPIAQ